MYPIDTLYGTNIRVEWVIPPRYYCLFVEDPSSSPSWHPPTELSRFQVMKQAVFQAAVGSETSDAVRKTFGRSSVENSSAYAFPQPLARKACGRCQADSIRESTEHFAA